MMMLKLDNAYSLGVTGNTGSINGSYYFYIARIFYIVTIMYTVEYLNLKPPCIFIQVCFLEKKK